MRNKGWSWSETLSIEELSGECQILFTSAGGSGSCWQLVKLWVSSVNFEAESVQNLAYST